MEPARGCGPHGCVVDVRGADREAVPRGRCGRRRRGLRRGESERVSRPCVPRGEGVRAAGHDGWSRTKQHGGARDRGGDDELAGDCGSRWLELRPVLVLKVWVLVTMLV